MLRGIIGTFGFIVFVIFAAHTIAPTYDVAGESGAGAIETINYANGIDGISQDSLYVHYDASNYDIASGVIVDERTGQAVQIDEQGYAYDDGNLEFDKPDKPRHYRVEVYDFDGTQVGEMELPRRSKGTDLSGLLFDD